MAAPNTTRVLGNDLVIGITMGDPGGIGPEIIVKALADPALRRLAKFIIFGSDEALEYAADLSEVEPFWFRFPHEKLSRDYPRQVSLADYDDYSAPTWIHAPTRASGEASIRFCVDAINAARRGLIDAVVTAPISKTSWKLAGSKWPGHTELLAYCCKSPRKAMMFVAGPLKMALATIHEALFEIRHKFTIGCVFEPIDLLDGALKEYFGIARPRIAVAGLNPHAGEDATATRSNESSSRQFYWLRRRVSSAKGRTRPIRCLSELLGANLTGSWPCITIRGLFRSRCSRLKVPSTSR